MNRQKITIIGAGVSGLIAAIELEKAGFAPRIIDQSDAVGGRVRTETIDGIPFDRGFQVLLTAYPEAERYLDYKTLDLIEFLPGSVIFKNKKQEKIGDPLRDASFLWPTTFASIGTVNDKRKVLQLSLALKKKTIEEIFEAEEISTMEYLKNYGFSATIIKDFFQPFFSGIFLENQLHTSSRMFEFVYKMFSTGYAAIPREGMEAIPKQLAKQLKHTEFLFNRKVVSLKDGVLRLENGESIETDYTIIATEPDWLLEGKSTAANQWKSCYNLYFSVSDDTPSLEAPIIGLLPEGDRIVNNFHYLTDVLGEVSDQKIISVTVVGQEEMKPTELVSRVEKDLATYGDIKVEELLQLFYVRKALPNLCGLSYTTDKAKISPSKNVFLCGDHLSNSSLNAAMASGRVAAEALMEYLKKVSV